MKHKSSFPKLKGKAILSPMAGVTDVAFRALARKYGAALTYTEFVSSAAISRKNKKTLNLIKTDPSEKPVAVQLFGHNEKEIIESAQMLEKKFNIIDINCGCPAWKVIKTGAGSELLKKPELIGKLVNKLASSISIPLTVKIRAGIDKGNINAVKVAKTIEDNGASALAIHGRTQKQGYKGKSDWSIIKKIKETLNIPVIGNGDIFSPEDFKEKLRFSGVDYIMIARGAIGNPFIFSQINAYLKQGTYAHKSKIEQFSEYLKLAQKHRLPFPRIKQQAVTFTKGIRKGGEIRRSLAKTKEISEIESIMNQQKLKNLKKN